MIKKLKFLLYLLVFSRASFAFADELPKYPLNLPEKQQWSFSGPFGVYDKAQLQRGLQVYREVCAACHGLKYVHFRDLEALGYSKDAIKAFAAQFNVAGDLNEEGEPVERLGQSTDTFPGPFANDVQAAFVNNGTAPVDLSLIARARAISSSPFSFITDVLTNYTAGGPDYIYGYLTGYQDAPSGRELAELNYYNPYFIFGDMTNMAPPLTDGMVSFEDLGLSGNKVPETVEQYAHDVSAFLMWAADPHMEKRKQLGMQVILFLIIFSVLCYLLKRSFWNELDEEDEEIEKT